jgi:hypothetical protein
MAHGDMYLIWHAPRVRESRSPIGQLCFGMLSFPVAPYTALARSNAHPKSAA